MPHEKLRPTFTFTEDRIAELRAVAPEAFEDGTLNWDILREALGNWAGDEDQDAEHFGLTWPGKRDARRLAAKPSHGTLRPAWGEGVNEDSTKNLYIEGDNLEVLKLLQKSYAGQVKMIYIDPPYNTGNDFVYKDNFTEPLEDYLRRSGQTSEKGELLTSNPKSSGRFHTNWLNMIYPRLRLARTLLRDDGAIFVSIDDNEVQHLRSVMDELFGEENFVTEIEWQKRYTRSNNTDGFTSVIDHILMYRKTESFEPGLLERDEVADSRYSNPDKDPRGVWKLIPFINPLSPEQRPNLSYPIKNPFTGEIILPKHKAWRSSRSVFEQLSADNRVYWGANGRSKSPGVKRFLTEVKQGITPINFWDYKFAGHTDAANLEIKELFEDKVFDTPKPSLLVKRMIEVTTGFEKEELILDFFSGASTTAQAVLQGNRVGIANRKFILVQLPEPTPEDSPARKAGYDTIAEIGKERIRRVITRMLKQPSLEMRETPEDLGFKVYKLGSSYFKAWQDYAGDNLNDLQNLFDQFETPLIDGWDTKGLLTEVLLMEGFPLDSSVEPQAEFLDNALFCVSSPAHGHRLWTCFDAKIMPSTMDELSMPATDVFICLDSALDDNAKLHLSQAGTLRTI